MVANEPKCIACEKSSREVPLLVLTYQDTTYWICPQHLPLLIHEPGKLAGKLPGADKLKGSEHKH